MIDANYIRSFVKSTYIAGAIRRGDKTVTIPVRAVEDELRKNGLPSGRTPMVCSALRGKKLQQDNGLVLDHWDGPPSGQSTTVVFHYRIVNHGGPSSQSPNTQVGVESHAQRAARLIGQLSGLMKDEIAAHGGTEGFMRWVRSDYDDEEA